MPPQQQSCKPTPKTEAPWASASDAAMPFGSSTHQAQFVWFPSAYRQAAAIKPKSQHDWSVPNEEYAPRSTSQDSFMDLGGGPRESLAPKREFKAEPWGITLCSTSQAQFIPHYGIVKREAIRPKRAALDTSPFDTRSTAQDAYMPFPSSYKPRAPIYPMEAVREAATFDHTSTSRAAYVHHYTAPYVPAKKPVSNSNAMSWAD